MSNVSIDDSLIVNEILTLEDSPKIVSIEGVHNNIVDIQANNAPSLISISNGVLISGSFDLTFNNLLDLPFHVKNHNIGVGPGMGYPPSMVNPQHPLDVDGTIRSTFLINTQTTINGDGANDLFLIKIKDRGTVETRLHINYEGIFILGDLSPPTPRAGGIYYDTDNEFYMGFS